MGERQEKYQVIVSIPGSYEGLALWVEASSPEDAVAQVQRLLKTAQEHAGIAPRVVTI